MGLAAITEDLNSEPKLPWRLCIGKKKKSIASSSGVSFQSSKALNNVSDVSIG